MQNLRSMAYFLLLALASPLTYKNESTLWPLKRCSPFFLFIPPFFLKQMVLILKQNIEPLTLFVLQSNFEMKSQY